VSLRARLLLLLFACLVASLAASAALAVFEARRAVTTELSAELRIAAQGARNALAEAPDGTGAARLVATFDGSRHVRAELISPAGAVIAASAPRAAKRGVPALFRRLVTPALPASLVEAGGARLRLLPFPGNEVAERWEEFREQLLLLAGFALAAAASAVAVISRGLQPLRALALALARLGAGERAVALPGSGPPEIASLAADVNRLARALDEAESMNRALEARILDLLAEERAELARDLHDDVGPLLFAIGAFAAAIEHGAPADRAQARASLEETLALLRRKVRELVARLHEAPEETGSWNDEVERILAFWRRVRPDIRFELEGDTAIPASAGPARQDVRRALQESLSNAVRHGGADRVRVAVTRRDGWLCLSVADNGRGQAAEPGFGLSGMRHRVRALGGTLAIETGAGWRVSLRLPLAEAQ
jgi:two-component system, NarL family, sensor histidine kinase UhpB